MAVEHAGDRANGQGPGAPDEAGQDSEQHTGQHTGARSGMDAALGELDRRRAAAEAMGGEAAIAKHRASGRMVVRDRVAALVDAGSWFEVGALAEPEIRRDKPVPGDAVVTGFGTLDGRRVGVIGIDATAVAGTTAPISMRKQGRLIEHAQRGGFPLVLLCDADGGRMPDVMGWRFSGLPLDFTTFLGPTDGRPAVPRAAAVLGPSYGDSALHAATAHYVVMTRGSSVALSGPSVVEPAIGERVTDEELGGPEAATAAGNAHLVVDSEVDALDALGAFLSYLPSNAALPAPVSVPVAPARDPAALADLVPTGARAGYDMREVLAAVADADSVLPWADSRGPSLLCALARIEGAPVGIVANQPLVRAGALDADALAKEHDFVDLCDTFGLPLVLLHDVPGLMIGTQAERSGILHAYERTVSRLARASVPRVGVVLRKAYGGGHFAMGGRPTQPDFLYAWPGAEMGFMAPETGIRTVHRRALDRLLAEEGPEARDARAAELTAEWVAESEPWEAAAHLSLDDVIAPAATRHVIATSIEIAWGERPHRTGHQGGTR
ncbi:acyl-CoA carboxylase subunit beta [Actinomycetospora straminea]|uniref:Carboxyl transferase domain-containing protein n=1 Tax=Actinomycetospora straminea TaxID=663607 RepID=A0ABP9F9G1_9PSEU|nr:carboxyl transferase domain-containing protein [Actinomycetospora straminea]MDD7936369.1 carboxyl transferase domain-containing protein [Actinomycetospora straminea]